MYAIRCGFCGTETAAAYCPRCKARVAPAPTRFSYGDRLDGGASGRRAWRWLVVFVLLAAAGGALYSLRYQIWYGPDATYALAIRDSAQFKAPLSLTVKKSVSAPDFGGGQLVGLAGSALPSSEPVYVLEARGLVQFGAVSNEERVVGTVNSVPMPTSLGAQAAPVQVEMKQSYGSATAALTPQGRKEAAAWTDTGGAWLVPIGTREVYRIDRVGGVKLGGGAETREVEFSWRWTPNGVGAAFDTNGPAFASLPERARTAAEALRWSSANAYRAVARLERIAGGQWRVAEIKKSEAFNRRTELSAF
jgi:hypothetical protein